MKLQDFGGGIPELTIKISQIRTWTYISNNHNWLENSYYWKEKTQQIENDLSDNLHISLTNKFIDTSSKYFINSSIGENVKDIEINSRNQVILDGKKYGNIQGFDLKIYKKDISYSLFSVSHVKKSIKKMIDKKIENFLNAPFDSLNLGDISKIKLNGNIVIYWGDEPIGKLLKGSKIYLPTAEAFNTELLSSEQRLLVSSKLQKWIEKEISDHLNPKFDEIESDISPEIRAIAFNCYENQGMFPVEEFSKYIKNMNQIDKNKLSSLGIRTGAKFFYIPNFLKKKAIELNAALWALSSNIKSDQFLPIPNHGRVSFTTELNLPTKYWYAIGYLCIKKFAFRVDVFEKIFFLARKKIKYGPFLETSELMNPIGCNNQQLNEILSFCGYSSFKLKDDKYLYFSRKIEKNKK